MIADDGVHGREPWVFNPSAHSPLDRQLGDANSDGAIDFADFLILSSNFRSNESTQFGRMVTSTATARSSSLTSLILSENFGTQA